jgi:integrase
MPRVIEYHSKKIDDFLSNFTSSSTIRGYRCHLKNFFEVIDKNPDDYIVDIRKLDNGNRIDALDEYEKDIKKFWHWLIENKRSPKTISNSIGAIKIFLKQYRIRLDDIVWENIRRRGLGARPVVEEIPVTPDILKQILLHGDAKARAMFLVMSSSGLRIGELVKLKIEDVDFNSEPTKIKVKYRGIDTVKTKTSRNTYISNEATYALKEWLKIRQKSLNLAEKRTNLPHVKINLKDDRVFPFHTSNVRKIWNGLTKKAEFSEKDTNTIGNDRYKVHPHLLRKYFRTYFSKHDRDIAELLMGHEGYLSRHYVRLTEEEIKREYLIGMKYLQVFEIDTTDQRVTALDGQLKEKDTAIQKLKDQMDNMNQILLMLVVKKQTEGK